MKSFSLLNPNITSSYFDIFKQTSAQKSHFDSSTPRVDVFETKKAYLINMELAGYGKRDVEISIKNSILSISSVKKEAEEKIKGDWLIRERCITQFSRSFTLPKNIDAGNVKTEFKNGLLSIIIPRHPTSKPRTTIMPAA